jgi:hypothetical protein
MKKLFSNSFIQAWVPLIVIIFSAGVGYGLMNEQIALINQKTETIIHQEKAAVLTITTLQNQQNTIEIQIAKITQVLLDNQHENLVSEQIQTSNLVSIPLNLYTINIAGKSAQLVF